MHTTINLDNLFEEKFPKLATDFKSKGYKLKDFQKEVIENVLENNTLAIMPTGGGKSLIYWLSGIVLDGITIVISPLTALIDEQTDKLKEQGYEVLTLHSGINSLKQVDLLKKFSKKQLNPQFIFVSPERISIDGFFEYCIKIRKDDIKLIAIDEVHCVSQWGTSFRPFYKRIPVFLDQVYGVNKWTPKILALTATLNPKEVADICTEFRIDKENIIKDELLMREEINLQVIKLTDEDEKEDKLWYLLNTHKKDKSLVYLYRKYSQRGVEDLCNRAKEKGFNCAYFHGDMTSKERQELINKYKNNEVDVIFATNAFGMGIDIPDINVVIHFMIPESVEQYYQEVGRAARNKKAANAYLLYSNKNIQVKKTHFIDKSYPSKEKLIENYEKINSNGSKINPLQYFDNEDIQKCLPYYLDNGLLDIKCKGIMNLKCLSDINDENVKTIYDSTKNKSLLSTIKKLKQDPNDIVDCIYSSVINEKSKLKKGFDKCLIVENKYDEIPEVKLNEINTYIEERKRYKHNLLDYFVYLLDENTSSIELHKDIVMYLGADRKKLGRVYSTSKGDKVRSKSEVIIANLLYENNIEYEYEKELFYEGGKCIRPDFTIKLANGKEIYWEHLGMIGVESYDKTWSKKLEVYNKYFDGLLEVTYEGTTICESATDIIRKLEKL